VYSWRDARVDRAERMRAGNSTRVLPNVEKGTWDGSGDEWQWKVEPGECRSEDCWREDGIAGCRRIPRSPQHVLRRTWLTSYLAGLSSFGTHPQDLGAYLTPLLDHASTLIPEHAIADTPIYVLATAGMRLLPPAQSDAVLRETCRIIQRDTRFKIPRLAGCEQQVAIISGEEEGLLGWIAINYLMDGFHFPTSLPPSASAAATAGLAPQARPKAKSTFGFLDLGGASTQIAFEPAHPDGEELTKVTLRMLDGTDVASNVFVTTFLGYGTNRARERYVSVLEQAHNGTHLGASASLAAFKAAVAVPTSTPQDLPASTRPSDLIRDPCLPDGLTLATGANATLLGTGSWEGCVQSLEPLLDKQALCARPPCLFHGVHVPKIEFSANHFVGVSEYWFSSNGEWRAVALLLHTCSRSLQTSSASAACTTSSHSKRQRATSARGHGRRSRPSTGPARSGARKSI
jgi:Golgi nucleoside diphosphatase